VRHRLGQGAEDGPGQQVAGQLAGVAGGRVARVQDAAQRRVDRDRAVGALIARGQRIQRALDRVNRVGVGVVHDGVQATLDLLRGPGVVDVQVRAVDRDGALDVRLVLVEPVRVETG